jgi:hypothetical protein
VPASESLNGHARAMCSSVIVSVPPLVQAQNGPFGGTAGGNAQGVGSTQGGSIPQAGSNIRSNSDFDKMARDFGIDLNAITGRK